MNTFDKWLTVDFMIKRLYRAKAYFTRGHGVWFSFLFNISNFVLIFYNLLWIWLPIPTILKSLPLFIMIFFSLYLPIAIALGRYDYTNGTFKVESSLISENAPCWIKLFNEIDELKKVVKNGNCDERSK